MVPSNELRGDALVTVDHRLEPDATESIWVPSSTRWMTRPCLSYIALCSLRQGPYVGSSKRPRWDLHGRARWRRFDTNDCIRVVRSRENQFTTPGR